jgi:hypothetical protein
MVSERRDARTDEKWLSPIFQRNLSAYPHTLQVFPPRRDAIFVALYMNFPALAYAVGVRPINTPASR